MKKYWIKSIKEIVNIRFNGFLSSEYIEYCGYISDDFPSWIEIDWEATAENVKQDYSELEYEGGTYFYRD